MSLANNLLSTLSVDEDDKTLVIDHYTRSIVIPKSITNLGVESDDDVLRLNFRMPRYLGSVDLSKFSIRINYINAEGEDDLYKVTDAKTIGDNITFSWLVGPIATAYKGTTRFNVCMVVTNSESVIQQEYNTAIASLPVLEGLEVDARVVSQYTDILEQWETRLFGISGTEEAKLVAVSEQEQENITSHGSAVLATIPSDYTTTSKTADKAERTKADAIICSAEGEIVKMEDSSDDYLRGLQVFGKTTQVTTTGKNLFDVTAALSNQKRGTSTVNDYVAYDNGVRVTTNSYDHGRAYIYLSLEAGTYNISADVHTGSSWNFSVKNYDTDTELVNKSSTDIGFISYSFTLDTAALVGFCFMSTITNGPPTIATNIQLELGTEATAYEPYSGGFVSPSPEWSQEPSSVTNPTVEVRTSNLFGGLAMGRQINKLSKTNTSVLDETAGTVTYSGGGLHEAVLFEGPFKPNTQYTLILNGLNTTAYTGFVNISFMYDDYSVFPSSAQFETHGKASYAVVTSTAGKTVKAIVGKWASGEVTLYYNKSGLFEGVKSVDDFEMYDGQTFALTNRVLHAIPVNSGGNYIDANGQQWVGDVIDFERGVYVQHFKTVTFTGQENWTQDTNYTCAYRVGAGHIAIGGLCTHYPTYFITEDIGAVSGVYMAYTVNHIITDTRFVNDLNGFTAFLAEEYEAGHPVTVIRRLNEPVEIPLTIEELNAFKELKSYYPNTTIFNDAGATMRVSYNADTKTWIENLIDSRIAAYLEGVNS